VRNGGFENGRRRAAAQRDGRKITDPRGRGALVILHGTILTRCVGRAGAARAGLAHPMIADRAEVPSPGRGAVFAVLLVEEAAVRNRPGDGTAGFVGVRAAAGKCVLVEFGPDQGLDTDDGARRGRQDVRRHRVNRQILDSAVHRPPQLRAACRIGRGGHGPGKIGPSAAGSRFGARSGSVGVRGVCDGCGVGATAGVAGSSPCCGQAILTMSCRETGSPPSRRGRGTARGCWWSTAGTQRVPKTV